MAQTAQEFWMALEAERNDLTYLKPARNRYEPPAPVVVTRVVAVSEKKQQARDRAMYHAGRYAEGARDQEALDGHKEATKLIKKGKQ